MNIGSPGYLIIVAIGSLYFILMEVIKMSRDRSGVVVKNIKSKKKKYRLTDIVLITVVILLLITSSGCSTKEPTTVINNNVKQEQAASEDQPSEDVFSSEGAQSSEDALLSEGSQSSDDALSSDGAQPSEATHKPDIEIIHPVEYTNWKENIGGIAKHIPEGYELWIIVYSPEKQQYYPYTKAVPQNDQWVTQINIGFSGDVYKKFDIIAVLADKESQTIFNDYLYAKEENKENIYSQGMYLVPDGAKEYSRVTLERRGDYNDDTND